MKRKMTVPQIILNVCIIITLLVMLYPLAMALWSSFKSSFSFTYTKWYPTLPLRISNLSVAFKNVAQYTLNTVIVAACGTLGSLAVSSLAAYAFSRMRFAGKKVLYSMVIALMMIPGVLTLVPSYMIYKEIVGLNNLMILILPTIVGGSIFGVFLLRSFFEGLPEAMFEAARLDGASEFDIYLRICLPLSGPIVGTLAIMQIINTWNDYMWPIITIQDDELLTISAGLIQRFASTTSTNYPITMASYLLSSLPLIIFFVFANKAYIAGLTSSGIKL